MIYLQCELNKLREAITKIEKLSPEISVVLWVKEYRFIMKILNRSKKRLQERLKQEILRQG